MSQQYPYYNEPTHDQGTVDSTSNNAARSTRTSSQEGRLILDVEDKIFLLEQNKHPLVTLLTNVGKVYDGKSWKGAGIRKEPTGNPEFRWNEDYYGGRFAQVSGTYSGSGSVDIDVKGAGSSSAYIFTPGDIVFNASTDERMLVETIKDADTITISANGRSFGSTGASAGSDGEGLYIVGNVNEENSGARNVNTTRTSQETNYTQIFKTSIAVSGTEKQASLYGGPDLRYQRAKKGTQHAKDIERAFWFGEKNVDYNGTQGKPRRSTGGILEFVTSGDSYVHNQGGHLTAPDFNTFLREAFHYGSDEKMLFCSGKVLQAINEFARGQIQTKPSQDTYGVNIKKYVSSFGTVNLVHNPLFQNDFAGMAFMLDMECFKYRYMNNRDTQLQMNVQANDADGQVDQYVSECGLQRMQAPRCALLKGVTG